LFVAVLIPPIKTPVYFVAVVQYVAQAIPPLSGLVTAVGDQHQLYVRVNTLDPLANFQKFSAVYGITVIAAKCYFAYLFYNIGTNLLLKKIQAQVFVQQAFGNFSPWTPGTSQGANAGRFNVPMIPL
jgi:hypothetical protein